MPTQCSAEAMAFAPVESVFPSDDVYPSRDDACHICTRGSDGEGLAYCAFVPSPSARL